MPSFDFPQIPMEGAKASVPVVGTQRITGMNTDKPMPSPCIASSATVHSIKIIVPGEPVPKGRPRARIVDSKRYAKAKRFVSFYQPIDTKAYERRISHEARQVMRGRGLLVGALRVEMRAYLSPPASWSATKKEKAHLEMILPTSRPDSDNFLKLIDACNQLVWHDDAQIVDMSVKKRYSSEPRLEIEVFAV